MQLKAKFLKISTGGPPIVVINPAVFKELGLEPMGRVRLMDDKKYMVAIVNVSETVKDNEIFLFEEVGAALKVCEGEPVTVVAEELPRSLQSIKKKMDGYALSKEEIYEIVSDIVDNRLTQVELAYFAASAYLRNFTMEEVEHLTRAMSQTGEMLRLTAKPIMDKHSIGGVPANRTTMVVVPIVAATGLTIPKTSSRSITDPAGTADTMEVLAPVNFNLEDIKRIVRETKGCIVWGGGVDIAPADDDIIQVEHPMQLDPTSMLLASIMAKKFAIGATDLLIDIPFGPGTKATPARARELETKFSQLGKRLGMNVRVIRTDGSQPIGHGIGPILEARDVLWILKNNKKQPKDLRKKAVMMAGLLLEMGGKARKGSGKKLAENILKSGAAWRKMRQIIKAQGGNANVNPEKLSPGSDSEVIKAGRSGKISAIDNNIIKRVCRYLGAPYNKGAGIYLYKHKGDRVRLGDKLFTMYAESGHKLSDAIQFVERNNPCTIK